MIKLFEYAPSGNCYKVRLILTQLEIPFERVAIDTGIPPGKEQELRSARSAAMSRST